jgi:predicted NBD/HSP70 family sugar kinase
MPTLVAIDIGGTTVKLALVRTSDAHEILIHEAIDTVAADPGPQIVARIAQAVQRMVDKTGERPVGVGVGCPGLIDNRNGIVVVSANLPTFKQFPLAAEIHKQVGLPTAIHNDAKAAVLGEYNFGAARGVQNIVLLTLGTGVGGGVITVGHYLGRGIAHFIDIFNPERVILAGGASRVTDLMMPGIRRSLVEQCSFDVTRDRVTIEPTTLPNDINVLGAAAVYLTADKSGAL